MRYLPEQVNQRERVRQRVRVQQRVRVNRKRRIRREDRFRKNPFWLAFSKIEAILEKYKRV